MMSAPERLRPLVLGKAKPQDRSEEEVRGYREAIEVGRNGAGKSSFAEALELLVTGTNRRWQDRSGIWSGGQTPCGVCASRL